MEVLDDFFMIVTVRQSRVIRETTENATKAVRRWEALLGVRWIPIIEMELSSSLFLMSSSSAV